MDKLREAMAGALARVPDLGRLTVIDAAVDGLVRFEVTRDEAGTPSGRRHPAVPYESDQPETGVGSGEVLLIRSSPDHHEPAERAAARLRQAYPNARYVAQPGAQSGLLLRQIIADEPLRCSYDLVVLQQHDGDRLALACLQLFPAGAARGAATRVRVRCHGSDERGTALAVVGWRDRRVWPVTIVETHLPPGVHTLDAELVRPGRVRFHGLPQPPVPSHRSWERLVAEVPGRFDPPATTGHLIIAVEFSGEPERVLERMARVGQILTTMRGGGPRASLLAYGEHSFDRRPSGAPVEIIEWLADPDQVLTAAKRLEERGPSGPGYPGAAPVEDMLAAVAEHLARSPAAPAALLTIGERGPHPPRAEIGSVLPCPYRRDWSGLLHQLQRRSLRFAAIYDGPSSTAHPIWDRLGNGHLASAEAVDIRQVGADLGLLATHVPHFPFPFIEAP